MRGSAYRVGVLASGDGSNLQALIDQARSGALHAVVAIVGCNRADARAISRARAAGIAVCVADRHQVPRRSLRQQLLIEALRAADVDLVVLAGFDEILQPEFLAAFSGRIINTHPSLLPAFAGTLHAVQLALDYGVKVTGCTVHLVTAELDGGPIVAQAPVAVSDEDTVASLHARIKEQEHALLPAAVRAFAEERVEIRGRIVSVVESPSFEARPRC
jgi:phosphoribosylglycinamide formyltransferase-1